MSPDSMSEDTCAKGVGGGILSGLGDRKATLAGGEQASSHWAQPQAVGSEPRAGQGRPACLQTLSVVKKEVGSSEPGEGEARRGLLCSLRSYVI